MKTCGFSYTGFKAAKPFFFSIIDTWAVNTYIHPIYVKSLLKTDTSGGCV